MKNLFKGGKCVKTSGQYTWNRCVEKGGGGGDTRDTVVGFEESLDIFKIILH